MEAQHFLTGTELSSSDLLRILELSTSLRKERTKGKNCLQLGSKTIESYSFKRKKEEPKDLAHVLADYCQAIELRTHQHSMLERIKGTIVAPLINGLSDELQPCQTLADLLSLKQYFPDFSILTMINVGDGSNILHSLLLLFSRTGANAPYACPKGYGPSAFVLEQAKHLAKESGAKIQSCSSPEKAVAGAHAIYTDAWTSMDFEVQESKRDQAFRGYQVNQSLYEHAQKALLLMRTLSLLRLTAKLQPKRPWYEYQNL